MWFVISKKIALFKLCYKYVYKGYSLDLIFFVYINIYFDPWRNFLALAIPAQLYKCKTNKAVKQNKTILLEFRNWNTWHANKETETEKKKESKVETINKKQEQKFCTFFLEYEKRVHTVNPVLRRLKVVPSSLN